MTKTSCLGKIYNVLFHGYIKQTLKTGGLFIHFLGPLLTGGGAAIGRSRCFGHQWLLWMRVLVIQSATGLWVGEKIGNGDQISKLREYLKECKSGQSFSLIMVVIVHGQDRVDGIQLAGVFDHVSGLLSRMQCLQPALRRQNTNASNDMDPDRPLERADRSTR